MINIAKRNCPTLIVIVRGFVLNKDGFNSIAIVMKAVLFDWDGTLADTMKNHYIAFREAMKDRVEVSQTEIYKREGNRAIEIIPDFIKGLSEEELRERIRKKDEEYARISGNIRMMPDAREVVKRVKESGLKVGLVTGTKRKDLILNMDPKDMEMFDHIVTGDDTVKPKPHPEPFLKGLEGLGMSPEECIVVENAPLGIKSAKSAGMKCIAVEFTLPRKYLEEADFVVRNIREAGDLILSKSLMR